MLRVEDLEFRRGEEVLFDSLNFVVHAGQRVALAGRNGVGKSTLFHLLRGKLQPDRGETSMPANWRIGYMDQEAEVTQRPALAYVIDGDSELRHVEAQLESASDSNELALLHSTFDDLDGYTAPARAASILSGLGFAPDEFEKPYAEFSGGWRIRLNLARALMSPCDLLLLDEPTNHLDLEAIMWLESWLRHFEGTVIFIAHDRAFLDACADHTLYLSGRGGEIFTGNYSSAERQRAERANLAQAQQAKRAAQAAHIQKFVDRFRAKASKAKQVQSRIKALERLADSPTMHLDSPYSVAFQDPEKVSNPLFSTRDLQLGYGNAAVLHEINLTVLPRARIGVLGANGAGKSTLLKALVGDLLPMQGELTAGQHSKVGYFAQHQLETLDPHQSALAMFTGLRPAWREQQCRDYLGRWGFDAGMTTRPISTLSGGEKARLVLACIALEQPAVLVLDEPTNHLDLDMRDALALALQDYAGAVVIVSHDRILLDKTVDEFWLLENHTLNQYAGDLDDYTKARGATLTDRSPAPDQKGSDTPDAIAVSKKEIRQQRANQRASLKHLRDQVKSLEKQLESTASKLSEVEAVLADGDTYASLPAEELDDLLARAGRYRNQLEKTEEDWLTASAELEAAEGC